MSRMDEREKTIGEKDQRQDRGSERQDRKRDEGNQPTFVQQRSNIESDHICIEEGYILSTLYIIDINTEHITTEKALE